MSRPPRTNIGGEVYHVLNRANARLPIFESEAEYADFQELLREAVERSGTRLLAYCLMPNHWHLVLWPQYDGELSECMRWLGVTHTNRWHAARGTTGSGHLYQGRFKSFVVQGDQHFWSVCRYVECNALRAGLAPNAEAWPWGSAHLRAHGDPDGWLSPGPLPWPDDWLPWINQPQTEAELERLSLSIRRGRPFGAEPWVEVVSDRFGLVCTLRGRGRPKKGS